MTTRTIVSTLIAILLVVLIIVAIRMGGVPGGTGMATTTVATTTVATTTQAAQVNSFADCQAAGYPVMESSPRQCRMPDGRVYAEETVMQPSYTNATSNDIVVTQPTPGSVTGKTFRVSGQARGMWYFEASFPVEVRDRNGTVLANAPAQAQGDWTTENFVPFSLDITVPQSYIGPATIILRKDNPSGLPERDASVSIPITIEY